ncbi:ECU03_0375 [Encephalitozoon cuniculi GB-M1]|uniref:Signal peptidase complex subunit 1 n=1 Tax=Encephalitozoon cuniculi (strain GB-M1) TaxID=284813 RepID=I7L4D8_ENCCU|nr:uncharacterized protein ECU03_0375 [Encephalitozoon cuniculi GB-M1]UYI28028.1 microsomal signal peptidase 12 kDa subunit (SPC12) [Encephalitozoon cuniculi]CCI73915.1 ECU03_0375 [Encephalitozoon cuniculi GB-M1]
MYRSFLSKIDPPIDYVGQKLASDLMYLIFGVGYTAAFVAGVLFNDLVYTMYISIATLVISVIIVIPSWRFYRRNPLKFRAPVKDKED